ncbi:response regulator [Glaciecola sp. SC05]|uniref:hybrid sensor histidine kinase/response regulator n=1 Tax=Glaciecola sp. SC05 TaxID=1987355 RepID=UPI0035284659
MNKLKSYCVVFVFACILSGIFAAPKAHAQNEIVLAQTETAELVTPKFAVYWQDGEPLTFDAFRANKDNMPYQFSDRSNFGFVKDGLWFHAKAINRTDVEKWVLSVRFAQLEDAHVYIMYQGELIYQASDGIGNKGSNFANPTFEFNLPKDEHVDIFMYASSASMSLLAPIYLQSEAVHEQTNQIDFLLWGGFYGAILILAMYAITFSFNYPSISNMLFFTHIAVVLVWQLNWSGHSNLIGNDFGQILSLLKPEELLILLCMSGTAFTLKLLPKEKYTKQMYVTLLIFIAVSLLSLVLIRLPLLSIEWRFVLTYSVGFSCLGINFLTSLQAFNSKYVPARPILVGWSIMFLGAALSTLYIFGYLNTNTFNAQLFQLALNIQAGAFLLSIVSKTQTELETELVQARADAENNFILVEEQNVHLDMARRDAVKASEVKSQFLANMSHEIRTPLNAIIGFSKALESKINVAERDEHIKIINSAATDLLTLVNDILDFSKMEAGQLSLNNKPFKTTDLFEDIAATMSKTAHLKHLEFIYDVDDMPKVLIGDIFRVKQLLINLIGNALKFTNYGYIALRAKVQSITTAECVLSIQIEDSGIGISDSDIHSIFNAFHQLDDELNKSYQGTGLGLVICQELVYLMQGELSVTSQPSIGSTFKATIPFKVQTPTPLDQDHSAFQGRKALVYDLWEKSQQTIVQQLTLSGFEVSTFDSYESLREHLQPDSFLFVTLGIKHSSERHDIINKISQFAPSKTVILFSGAPPPAPLVGMMPSSTRVMRLPLTARKIASLEFAAQQNKPSLNERQIMDLPSVRMLAVDDMELNLRLLETWLKHSPITLDLAYDGPSAIKKCEQTEYDIILMDIQMPSMDGIATTKHIRQTPLNMGTPVIAVTAHALAQEKQHFLESGLEDFISKPIELDKLILLINEWCEFSDGNNEKLPDSIDWELALLRSNHNPEVAMSFMDDFMAHLGEHRKNIQQHAERHQVEELLASIHKLHGACCYTGVPRLQAMCFDLEEMLKSNPGLRFEDAVNDLMIETSLLINDWSKRRQRLV